MCCRRDDLHGSNQGVVLLGCSCVGELPDLVRCLPNFAMFWRMWKAQYEWAALGRKSDTPLSIPLQRSQMTAMGVSWMPMASARCWTKNRLDSLLSEGAKPRAIGNVWPSPSNGVATRMTPLQGRCPVRSVERDDTGQCVQAWAHGPGTGRPS